MRVSSIAALGFFHIGCSALIDVDATFEEASANEPGASAAGSCSGSDRRCSGNIPETCSQGVWLAEAECAGGLDYCLPSSGSCVACEPGEEECQSGVAHRCDDAGSWTSLNSCSGTQVTCSGCDLREPCDNSSDCSSNACISGSCAECEPNATDCVGTTPRICSEEGSWVNQAPCLDDTPVCGPEGCTCENGSEKCDEGLVSVCEEGQWISMGGCVGGTINCGSCQAGESCDADGDCQSGSCSDGVCQPASFSQQGKLNANDAAEGDQFGAGVALDGDTALIGAPGHDYGGSNTSGSAYVFVRSGSLWTQQQKLVPGDPGTGHYFGGSVALSGDTALIAARGDGERGTSAGAAYVFVASGSSWTQQQKLVPSDLSANDQFGGSVALSGDTLLIGAQYDDDGGSNSGSAYVFVRDSSSWTQQQKLVPSDPATDDLFGNSVALGGDTALVGAEYDDDGGSDSGSAYVFVRSGSSWAQQQKLLASDAAAGDRFGFSVALWEDTALIGARDDDGGTGSAYLFVRSGSSWTQQQKLLASDPATADGFGSAVTLSGNTALVAATGIEGSSSFPTGSAYVFVGSGSSWTEQQKLVASDAATGDFFGRSLALSGNSSLVGAPYHDDAGESSGSAYVFAN